MMEYIQFELAYKARLIALWQRVFLNPSPWNDACKQLDEKLAFKDDLIFIAVENNEVLAAVMAGYDGHRGWIYNVATDPKVRGQGCASKLLKLAEDALKSLGCVKVNLQIVANNHEVQTLYEKNGYHVEPRISMGKRL